MEFHHVSVAIASPAANANIISEYANYRMTHHFLQEFMFFVPTVQAAQLVLQFLSDGTVDSLTFRVIIQVSSLACRPALCDPCRYELLDSRLMLAPVRQLQSDDATDHTLVHKCPVSPQLASGLMSPIW